MLPQIIEMADAGSGVDLISRALGIGAEVVRDALHLHRTGKRPPGHIDGRRRKPRQPGKPFVPKYQQIAPKVDRSRKAGEGFDRLAREMKVSRPTVVQAYDFANRDEAAAAARESRTPTRPRCSLRRLRDVPASQAGLTHFNLTSFQREGSRSDQRPVSRDADVERTDAVLQTVRAMSKQFMRCHQL
jgi:transposase-like protein